MKPWVTTTWASSMRVRSEVPASPNVDSFKRAKRCGPEVCSVSRTSHHAADMPACESQAATNVVLASSPAATMASYAASMDWGRTCSEACQQLSMRSRSVSVSEEDRPNASATAMCSFTQVAHKSRRSASAEADHTASSALVVLPMAETTTTARSSASI